jgi:outer membrane protein assembly factor BamB
MALLLLYLLPNASFSQEDACMIMSGEKACDLNIQGSIYHIENSGVLTVKHAGKSSAISFRLPNRFLIDEVRYQIHDKNILFVLGITGDDSASALLAHFDLLQGRILWSTEIHAFNISPLLIAGSHVYIGGIGTVAKLRLSDGKIIWKHTDLYESGTGSYNAFELPRKEGNIVIFKELSASRRKKIREIHVDDTAGRILSK